VTFETPSRDDVGPSGRVLILVTPDAQRTMNTFLGAAQQLSARDVDLDQVRAAGILYLEGYLWDPEVPRAAMEVAIAAAREAGRKIAFTLSDTFCVSRHRDGFHQLLDERKVDILFANEAELAAMTGEDDFDAGLASLSAKVPLLVVTRGEAGAVAVAGTEHAAVPAEPIERLVDTTGAGDLFAAGFLAGQARGLGLEPSLRLGAIAAAEVIQHYGARPEKDLKALAADVLA
jgi:sugar/nucleoside kinase (ribokinase family)